jgi:hypothetical protein
VLRPTSPIVWSDGTTTPPTLRRYPIAVIANSAAPEFWLFQNAVGLALAKLDTSDDYLLDGDTLEISSAYIADDQCSPTVGAQVMQQLSALPQPPIAVIGPFCSVSAVDGIMTVANKQRIPVISPAAPVSCRPLLLRFASEYLIIMACLFVWFISRTEYVAQ